MMLKQCMIEISILEEQMLAYIHASINDTSTK
jgi:hypothetical protein